MTIDRIRLPHKEFNYVVVYQGDSRLRPFWKLSHLSEAIREVNWVQLVVI